MRTLVGACGRDTARFPHGSRPQASCPVCERSANGRIRTRSADSSTLIRQRQDEATVGRKTRSERKVRPGYAQVSVLSLEPKRGALVAGCLVMAMLAGAVAAAALAYRSGRWPTDWPPHQPLSSHATGLVAAVAGAVALLFLLGVVVNGRRWRTSRRVERMSNDPALSAYLPDRSWPTPTQRAATIPALTVRFVQPGKLPKPAGKLARVTAARNVIGRRPLHIAYLRLFERASDPDVRRGALARVRLRVLLAQHGVGHARGVPDRSERRRPGLALHQFQGPAAEGVEPR